MALNVSTFLYFRRYVHAELQKEHNRYENLKITLEEFTPTGNNGSPEANHYYDHIHQSKQEDENHYEKVS